VVLTGTKVHVSCEKLATAILKENHQNYLENYVIKGLDSQVN
jgi:hypothetical protein